jgi:hypothetical protein
MQALLSPAYNGAKKKPLPELEASLPMQANHFFYPNASFEQIKSKPKFKAAPLKHPCRPGREAGFSCTACRRYVSCDSELSGVRSRNHCPHCLWSRHMDLNRPGDRLSLCRRRMKPVGLALKKTNQKYSLEPGGELKLIHVCEGCGKISINRIAADDNAFMIWIVFENSLHSGEEITGRIRSEGIQMLQSADEKIVHMRLYGK